MLPAAAPPVSRKAACCVALCPLRSVLPAPSPAPPHSSPEISDPRNSSQSGHSASGVLGDHSGLGLPPCLLVPNTGTWCSNTRRPKAPKRRFSGRFLQPGLPNLGRQSSTASLAAPKEQISPPQQNEMRFPSPRRALTRTWSGELCPSQLRRTEPSQTPEQSIQPWHRGCSSQLTLPHLLRPSSSKLFAPDSVRVSKAPGTSWRPAKERAARSDGEQGGKHHREALFPSSRHPVFFSSGLVRLGGCLEPSQQRGNHHFKVLRRSLEEQEGASVGREEGGERCRERAARWEAAAAARRRWGEEAADVRRQHLLRACSAPAQPGEEGGGWCHRCCIVIEQDEHGGLLGKLVLPLPPRSARSGMGRARLGAKKSPRGRAGSAARASPGSLQVFPPPRLGAGSLLEELPLLLVSVTASETQSPGRSRNPAPGALAPSKARAPGALARSRFPSSASGRERSGLRPPHPERGATFPLRSPSG